MTIILFFVLPFKFLYDDSIIISLGKYSYDQHVINNKYLFLNLNFIVIVIYNLSSGKVTSLHQIIGIP